VTGNEDPAGRTWADTARAVALLRLAVRALDRLVGRCGPGTLHPELAMAVIESSQSARRALVTLAEARQLLADRFRRLPLPDAVSDGPRAKAADRVQEN
jgi:hypothetical protein